jgi:hypothetical protein
MWRSAASAPRSAISASICHHLGRDVHFDPASETFGDDKAANALLTKQYRDQYPLPRV